MALRSRLRARRVRLAIIISATSLVAVTAGLAAPDAPATPAGVTVVGTSAYGSSGSKSSITVKRPKKTAAGQVMVAAIAGSYDEPGFTPPAGWTTVRGVNVPGLLRLAVYVKVAGASEPSSYTWRAGTKRRLAGGITTYAGVDTSNPVDGHSAFPNGAPSTELFAPGVVTSTAGSLPVHVGAINAEGKLRPPPGMTARWKAASLKKGKAADALVAMSDGPPVPAGDTGPRTATATKAGPTIGVLLALRPGDAGSPPPPPPPPPVPDPAPVPPGTGDPVLVGAGDIAYCSDNSGARATAALLDGIPGTVFTLGDNAYGDGTPEEYQNCYEPTWGRHRARTAFAVAGNHDYNTPGAAGHYGYFGAAAGDPARGYYDAMLGTWHVIVLNSNCDAIGGCGAGSPQEQWLRSVLATNPAPCTIALWHHPTFSSGTIHRSFPTWQPFWQALYDHGADLVLVASDHLYERFGFQNPAGDADAAFGLRQFTVGTGGRGHQSFKAPLPNSEVRNGSTYGVLALTLHPDSYDWRFVPEAGGSFTDQGTSACHGAPR
jgi:hypothetical protein